MTMFEEFLKGVKEGKDSFCVATKEYDEDQYYYFFKNKFDCIEFVYVKKADSSLFPKVIEKAKPVAVVSQNDIYLIDDFFFDIREESNYKKFDHVYSIYEKIEEMNKYVKESVFSRFYDSLETVELSKADIISCVGEARKEILLGKKHEVPYLKEFYGTSSAVKTLAGSLDIDSFSMKKLEEEKERYQKEKSKEEFIQKCLNDPDCVKDWEKRMFSALNELDALTAVVTFEYNGFTATESLSVNVILHTLIHSSYFTSYSFSNEKKACEVFCNLELINDNLTCENIKKISYRRKTIYEK